MEKLSAPKKAILDVLDEQIGELEKKLEKVQPLINELAQLRRTRATLLSERTTTGSVGSGTRLTMEQVIHALRESEWESMSVTDLAKELGVNDNTMRSHLNRHKDVRYRQNGDGEWSLIGEEEEE